MERFDLLGLIQQNGFKHSPGDVVLVGYGIQHVHVWHCNYCGSRLVRYNDLLLRVSQ